MKAAYDRTIAEWLAGSRQPLQPAGQARAKGKRVSLHQRDEPAGITIGELILAYLKHAEEYYRRLDGSPTGEVEKNIKYALRPLNHLYGTSPARRIRPKHLKAVRRLMVDGYEHPKYGPQVALSRKHLNTRVSRIVRMFKWAVEEELIPDRVWLRLTTVRALQAGRSKARETKKVPPVAVDDVEKTIPHMRPQPAGAVRLQLLTGMRSGEVLPLCADHLDRSGVIWIFRPGQHKKTHEGKDRVVAIGPKAQAVLLEFIKIRCPLCGIVGRPSRIGSPDGIRCGACARRADSIENSGPCRRIEVQTDRPLFSPCDEQAERFEDLRANRKSKVQPSQQNRRKKIPKRRPGLCYSPTNYQNAVKRACRKAGVPEWHPHQLRHPGPPHRRAGGRPGCPRARQGGYERTLR